MEFESTWSQVVGRTVIGRTGNIVVLSLQVRDVWRRHEEVIENYERLKQTIIDYSRL